MSGTTSFGEGMGGGALGTKGASGGNSAVGGAVDASKMLAAGAL